MASRKIIVLVGPKGSGKSFIGHLASEQLGVRFLRVEPIFLENLASSRLEGEARDREGYAKVLAAVDVALVESPQLVLEATGASGAFPEFLEALRARAQVKLVAVRAPAGLCLERVRTRDQSVHIPVSDDRVLEINARAVAVRLPWDLEIDNGGPAPKEQLLALLGGLLAGHAPTPGPSGRG